MKKRILSAFLTLTIVLALLPATASAADTTLPDWYFLFAIFKNVDADCMDSEGNPTHAKYSMTQDEVDVIRDNARQVEEYLNSVGVIRAHVDVVEIDATLTELRDRTSGGSYVGAEQAEPLLKGKVDLDKYDHITCAVSLGISMRYIGVTGSSFENGAGHACVNYKDRENCLKSFTPETTVWPPAVYVHEYLHFMENMSKKWGVEFGLHDIRTNFYMPDNDNGKECYREIMLNRAKGNAGTGVAPTAWQYPPHVLRTMTELTVPSGVTSIGEFAFARNKTLTRVFIPSNVTSIGGAAFQACSNLTSVSLPASITRVEGYTFVNCGLKDVYYSGSEAQWKAIPIGVSNGSLQNATIHYNSLLADVKTTDYFAQPVVWALENGITSGTGNSRFSPGSTCTQAQILTFLWRAKGSPDAAGAVTGSEYYAVPVQWAKEQGIVSAAISPNAPCTRSDAVTYLWKLAGSPAASGGKFSDVSASADYAQAVAWAVKEGITSGTGADTFSPDSACTRGQIVTFLYRALA